CTAFSFALAALPSFPTRRSSDLDVIVVLYDKLRCQKCHTPVDSEDDGLPNLIPFDSNLIPTFLELHRKGYMISLSPADEGESISDRKSTRLNSSHVSISYAVFCL